MKLRLAVILGCWYLLITVLNVYLRGALRFYLPWNIITSALVLYYLYLAFDTFPTWSRLWKRWVKQAWFQFIILATTTLGIAGVILAAQSDLLWRWNPSQQLMAMLGASLLFVPLWLTLALHPRLLIDVLPPLSNRSFQPLLIMLVRYKYIVLALILGIHQYLKLAIEQGAGGINVESDLMYYDARLFLEGKVPYRDFITREPLLLLLTSAFVFLLKDIPPLLLNTHLLFSLGTIVILYLIGKRIANPTIGLLCALVYALCPLLLNFPSAHDQFYGMYYLFLLATSVWFLVEALHRTSWRWYGAAGLALGITVMTYRGALPYTLVFSVISTYILWRKNEDWRSIWRWQRWLFTGLSLGIIPPLVVFGPLMGVNILWLNEIIGVTRILVPYLLYLPTAWFTWHFLNRSLFPKWSYTWMLRLLPILLAILFLFVQTGAYSINDRLMITHDYARAAGYILLPSILLSSVWLVRRFFGESTRTIFISILINIILLVIIMAGSVHEAKGSAFHLSSGMSIWFNLTIVAYSLFHFALLPQLNRILAFNNPFFYTLGLFLLASFVANTFVEWLWHYIVHYVLFLILLTVFYFSVMLQSRWKKAVQYQLLGVIALGFFSLAFFNFYDYNPNGDLQRSQLERAIQYIQTNTKPSDTIFTTVPTFAFRSGRVLDPPLTHPVIYIFQPPLFSDYNPYGTVPTITQIKETIERNKTPYIIADPRTKSLFLTDRHPELLYYIVAKYEKVVTFGEIDIYRRIRK